MESNGYNSPAVLERNDGLSWRAALKQAWLPLVSVTLLSLTSVSGAIAEILSRPLEQDVFLWLGYGGVVTGEMPSAVPFGWVLVVLAGVVGAAVALLKETSRFRYFLSGISFSVLVIGTGAFAVWGIKSPWLFCLFNMALCAAVVRARGNRLSDERRRRLYDAFEGFIPPARLRAMLKSPPALPFEPTSRVVTVMYIKITGFSIAAERQTPKQAFHHLKEVIVGLTEIVHEHGGVVDKLMGDSLLCFFGAQYDGSSSTRDHADKAIQCAIELQKKSVKKSLDTAGDKAPIYPLQIGINTTSIYMGDLGNSHRIEMTIIGEGVAFASDLESACDSYGIMISPSTRDIMVNLDSLRPQLRKRLIQFGQLDKLIEAYECDAFPDEPARVKSAVAAFRKFAEIERKDVRWALPSGVTIDVQAPDFEGELINFSENGLGIRINQYLGRGVIVPLTLDNSAMDLAPALKSKGLLPLVCEVRWSRPLDDGTEHVHGLLIKNLTADQKKELLVELRECLMYAKAS